MPDAADKLPFVVVAATVNTATAHATRAHTNTRKYFKTFFDLSNFLNLYKFSFLLEYVCQHLPAPNYNFCFLLSFHS